MGAPWDHKETSESGKGMICKLSLKCFKNETFFSHYKQGSNYRERQLTLEQHSFELHGST